MQEIITKSQKEIRLIPLGQVYYIRQELRKVCIATGEEKYYVYGKLAEMEKKFGENFGTSMYKPLKYLVINFDKIAFLSDQTIVFKNDERIALGRDNFLKTKKAFSTYHNIK